MQIVINRPSIEPTTQRAVEALHYAYFQSGRGGVKICTITAIRKVFELGLRDAKDLYEVVVEGAAIENTNLA